MPVISYTPQGAAAPIEVKVAAGESVLDALLRQSINVAHGCRAGVCQSCMMQTAAPVAPSAQSGLKPVQRQAGYFLACCCYPERDMVISEGPVPTQMPASVVEKTLLSDSVLRLRLQAELSYMPGQYITLEGPAEIGPRCYSLASVPATESFLELHIRRHAGGLFSQWAFEQLQLGQTLTLRGALGECYYQAFDASAPLLLAGTGTGLAPLYGIARAALQQGHSGPVCLLMGARQASDFYYVEALAALQRAYTNLEVCLMSLAPLADADAPMFRQGNIYQYLSQALPTLQGASVYLCGAPSFVAKARKQCFLAGAAMADIHADAFLPATGEVAEAG